jgi:DNA integrity scanning protein DisA with diadenylate cyclase activity
MRPDSITPIFDKVCGRVPWCSPAVLSALLDLAIEIAREGREGRRIGTLFTIGQADAVLTRSRPLILDPLACHSPQATSIFDANLRGTVKELAQLDGAFVVADDGTVRAACRYLDASVGDVELPLGLGSRHLAAASISKTVGVLAIVVSESAIVRVFHAGALIAEIIPELWLLRRHLQPRLRGPVSEQHVEDLAFFMADEAEAGRDDRGE